MGATEPTQVIEQFMKYFNSADVDGLLDNVYEEDVVLVPAPGGDSISGKAAVREVLQGFLGMGGSMTLLGATAFQNGDIALTHSQWRLEVAGSDPMEATTAEVVRRQADGTWKYMIDNPWGGGVLGASA